MNSKDLDAIAELLDLVTTTKKISVEFKGPEYIVRDMANHQTVSRGDLYSALACARRYKE